MEALTALYMDEVLGIKLGSMPVASLPPVTVECEPLTRDTEALLKKILSSADLGNFVLYREGQSFGQLHFRFLGQLGKSKVGVSTIWDFPKLSEMLGTSSEVTTFKKQAWQQLQQIMQERRTQ